MPAYFHRDKGVWYFEFDKVINGQRIRTTKFLPKGWSQAQAETYSHERTKELYAAATGVTAQRALIEDAVRLYLEQKCPNLKNGAGVIAEMARIHWAYAGRFMDELGDVARDYLETERSLPIDEQKKPATLKNRLSYLRAACRYAQRFHGMAKGLDLSISMPTVRNERQFYATRAQMIEIARACPDRHARAMIRFDFYTGMRLSEMMSVGAQSEWINDLVILPAELTKTHQPRAVPLHPKVWVLQKYFPIPFKKRWMQRLIRRAMNAVDMKHLVLHDVRHSTASALINSGEDLYTVGTLLGHADPRSSKRYAHLATRTLAAAVRKIK